MDGSAASGARADLCGAAPDAARRDLDERKQAATGVRERSGIVFGKPLLHGGAQLASGARPLGQQAAGERKDGLQVDASQPGRELGMAAELRIQHGLHERAQP